MIEKGIREVRVMAARSVVRRWASCAFAIAVGLSCASYSARADSGAGSWTHYMMQVGNCQAAINDDAPEGARCLLGNGLKLVLDESFRMAEAYGKQRFGAHFQIAADMLNAPVPDKIGLLGDVDVVLPFSDSGLIVSRQGISSLFFQQGVTRSWDDTGPGLFRNDLRHGFVRRFRVSKAVDADILGISAFHLLNVEHGHRVLVPAVDYTGRWGIGSFRYYLPATGWRPGSGGYEERALEGSEFGMRFDVTTTIELNTAAYRWRAEDGSNSWDTGARVALGWRPHPWLNVKAGYDGLGTSNSSFSIWTALQVPLGSGESRPEWEGLGLAPKPATLGAGALWRPAADIGAIRVARRSTAAELVADAEIRFLQDRVNSGDEVRVQVILPSPAPEDITVVVRLVPGTGPNPAVPGEDFVDEPVEATISEATTSITLSIELLRNGNMQQSRSLDATVSVAS